MIFRRWRCVRPRFRWRLKQLIPAIVCASCLLMLVQQSGAFNATWTWLRHIWSGSDDILQGRMVSARLDGDYQLENPYKSDFSRGQSKIIDQMLGRKIGGFFVDLGAGNGETNSVSLFFERERGWKGVLVEADQVKHEWSIIKNRHAHLWNLRIQLGDQVSPQTDNDVSTERLFQLINQTSIDLLIVNLKGSELEFLKQLNLTQYQVKVITVELPNTSNEGAFTSLTELLKSRNYSANHLLVNSFQGKKDVIFVKN